MDKSPWQVVGLCPLQLWEYHYHLSENQPGKEKDGHDECRSRLVMFTNKTLRLKFWLWHIQSITPNKNVLSKKSTQKVNQSKIQTRNKGKKLIQNFSRDTFLCEMSVTTTCAIIIKGMHRQRQKEKGINSCGKPSHQTGMSATESLPFYCPFFLSLLFWSSSSFVSIPFFSINDNNKRNW